MQSLTHLPEKYEERTFTLNVLPWTRCNQAWQFGALNTNLTFFWKSGLGGKNWIFLQGSRQRKVGNPTLNWPRSEGELRRDWAFWWKLVKAHMWLRKPCQRMLKSRVKKRAKLGFSQTRELTAQFLSSDSDSLLSLKIKSFMPQSQEEDFFFAENEISQHSKGKKLPHPHTLPGFFFVHLLS